MMIMIDELVNLYKIPNAITRQNNYEKLLTMYNDTLQGKARYLGIIMGATPRRSRTSGGGSSATKPPLPAGGGEIFQTGRPGPAGAGHPAGAADARRRCWSSAKN